MGFNTKTENRKEYLQKDRSAIVETAWQVAGEELGENEKDWVEKVAEKKMAAVFSYDRVLGSRYWRLVFFFPVKVIWLIF